MMDRRVPPAPGCEPAASAAQEAVFAESHPSRGAPVSCPSCGAEWEVSMHAAVGKDQRLKVSFAPMPGEMIQAQIIGEKLKLLDRIFKSIAREDGGQVRSYIEGVTTHEDGTLEFHLAVLAVKKFYRDTDRSGEADETAEQAQPEARAGAEGIAK